MAILFEEYDLIAKSGLFDPQFYLHANPDVARVSLDPIIHYLENGGHERRQPGPGFDTGHYLEQCQKAGEPAPSNPLLHFLTIGIKLGLTPIGQAGPPTDAPAQASATPASPPIAADLYVDVPQIRDGQAVAPIRGGLSVVGWALAAGGVQAVEIALDGKRIMQARIGLPRADVAAAFPDREGAGRAGYAVHLPPRALAAGIHRVTVSLLTAAGVAASREFRIEAQAEEGGGFWQPRQRMSQGEADQKLGLLHRLGWQPRFQVVIGHTSDLQGLQRSLASLVRQAYGEWQVLLVPPRTGRGPVPSALKRVLAGQGFEGLEGRVTLADAPTAANKRKPAAKSAAVGARAAVEAGLVLHLAPGDELGVDALLEWALATGRTREADFFYADDRRPGPAGQEEAYLKPGWSPDLLLATNYIGRAWCARVEVIERAGLTPAGLAATTGLDTVLRLTEAARRIGHVSRVLYRCSEVRSPDAEERAAIAAALARREIAAEVKKGCAAGHHRVVRALPRPGKVSIIIPTRGADGHIQRCLKSLRALTVYPDYEVICVENIPKAQRELRTWLAGQVDRVLKAPERFNWSAFNNLAARQAAGEYLLFLNDDIEIVDPQWLHTLVAEAQRPEVGVVGPLLTYPDGGIQHAGMVMRADGVGMHAFRYLPEEDPGYFGLARTQRNVLAVTGACLLTRRAVFKDLGGFDEKHDVINNDVDFCLRAHERGLLNIYTPHARLVHHELGSRGGIKEHYDAEGFDKRWRSLLSFGDPYFNPGLSREQENLSPELEPAEAVCARHPLFRRESVRRLLIIKLDHIGDCITALPAVRRLKELFPAAAISVLANRATGSIWKSEPGVAEVIEFDVYHARSGLGKLDVTPKQLQALGQDLGERAFDLAVDLRKHPDVRHFLRHSGARWLAGFDQQGRFPWLDIALEWDEDVPLRGKRGHVSDDLLALVECIAVRTGPGPTESGSLQGRDLPQNRISAQPAQPARLVPPPPAPPAGRTAPARRALPVIARKHLGQKPFVCVHPASGSVMRQWPPERFAELVDMLLQQGLAVALVGGPADRELADRVLKAVVRRREVADLVGKLSLQQLPDLLKATVLFVGNNSGPQHVAASLGVPTVGVHSGVVDAVEWAPLGANALAVRRRMSCSPCYLERREDCQRGVACLTGLTAAEVYGVCVGLLTGPDQAGRV